MLNQIKVLHLLDACAMGGAEKMLVEMLSCAHDNKYDWHFVSFQGGVLYPNFESIGVPCALISRRCAFDLSTIFSLRSYIKKRNIQVVHTHAILEALYAGLAITGLNVKLVHTYHGYAPNEGIKDRFARKVMECSADKHVFVSKDLENHFIKRRKLNKNLTTIENGTELSKDLNSVAPSLREELGISETTQLWGMVGNFNSTGRDQMTICQALAQVPKSINFAFVFIGCKNPQKPHFFDDCVQFCQANSLSDRVFFLGQRPQAQNYLPQFNAYVYASNHDSFGLTLIEAMARKVPLIANDLEPFKVITENGKFATLYPSKDYTKLAEILQDIANNPDFYQVKVQEALKHVKAKYAIERVVKDYSAVYQQILK